jgi:hypothetical protein
VMLDFKSEQPDAAVSVLRMLGSFSTPPILSATARRSSLMALLDSANCMTIE